MKTIDNKIKYYELLMCYDDTSKYKKYELAKGFHYSFYKPGDELDWVDIHIKSGEFTSIEQGLEWFHKFYDYFLDDLYRRCIFIVDDETNEKVATVTVSLLKKKEYGYEAAIDWLAIKKEYQGRGLAKPLISKFIELSKELGYKKIMLHTQTTTWLAVKLYLDLGFEILNKKEINGWNIIKTLTNHEKLSDYKCVSKDEIFDKRNIEIEKILINIFGTDKFNYNVWHKDNQHSVYVYNNNQTYEYEYYYINGKIELREVKHKKYNK